MKCKHNFSFVRYFNEEEGYKKIGDNRYSTWIPFFRGKLFAEFICSECGERKNIEIKNKEIEDYENLKEILGPKECFILEKMKEYILSKNREIEE